MSRARTCMFVLAGLLAASGCGDGGQSEPTTIAERAVFTVTESPYLRIYTSDADGRRRTLLVSQLYDDRVERSRPVMLVQFDVSRDGTRLAYRFRYPTTAVSVVDVDGRRLTPDIPHADDFGFSPDGSRLLYGVAAPPEPLDPGVIYEAPLHGPASRWFLRPMNGGEDRALDVGDSAANGLAGWIDDARVLLVARSAYGGIGNRLSILDVDTGALDEVPVPEGIQLGGFAADAGSAALIILPPHWGAVWSCDLFRLDGTRLLPLLQVADHDCQGLAWNGPDELWHGRATGPHGRIDVTDAAPSGYYILPSVYRYRVSLGRDEPVVKTDGLRIHRFQGLSPGRAIVSSSERIDADPPYRLEVRDLSGGHARTLAESPNEMLFLGWMTEPAR